MATVTELVTEFSYTGSESPLNSYNQSLGKSIALLASVAAAMAASGAAVAKWASGILEGERSIGLLAQETGLAVARIQELSFAAEMSGGSAGAMESTIESLTATIGEAAQKGSEDFSRLGISVRNANGQVKNADQVLSEVSSRFKQLGLSMAEQKGFASALGIDSSLLLMMNKSGEEIGNLTAQAGELGTTSKEQAKATEEYNQALVTQRFAMDGLRRLVANGLAPELTRMSEGITELIKNNKDWVVDGLQLLLAALNNLGEMLARTWPVLAAGVGVFVALKVAAIGFGTVMATIFSPVVLITAGIVALLVIVDDLIVAFQGGESIIRDFFLTFFDYDITPLLQDIVGTFNQIMGKVMEIGGLMVDFLGGLFSTIGALWMGDFTGALESLKEAFGAYAEAMGKVFELVFGGVFDWVKDSLTDLLPNWAKKLLGFGGEKDQQIDQSARPGGTVQNNNRSSNVAQDIKIDVRSSDPQKAADLTAENLNRQMRDAQDQADRGGM